MGSNASALAAAGRTCFWARARSTAVMSEVGPRVEELSVKQLRFLPSGPADA